MNNKIIDEEFISRLEGMSFMMKQAMNGYYGGNHKAPSYGSTVEFADYREYVPGDDLRRIDWNLYSRFEKHYIRLFVDERQMHTQVFLDCSGSMMNDNSSKAYAALQIAAAFGYLSVQEMDRVSFQLVKGENAQDLCGVITGKEAFYGAMSLLNQVEFSGEANLEQAICKCANPGYDDGMTVIISDLFTESDWKKAVDYLLYRHREVMVVQVLSPEEMNPEYDGRIQLLDMEAEDILDDKNMKMRITRGSYQAYLQALRDYQNDVKHFCDSRQVSYLTVNCEAPIEKELFQKLCEMEVVQ